MKSLTVFCHCFLQFYGHLTWTFVSKYLIKVFFWHEVSILGSPDVFAEMVSNMKFARILTLIILDKFSVWLELWREICFSSLCKALCNKIIENFHTKQFLVSIDFKEITSTLDCLFSEIDFSFKCSRLFSLLRGEVLIKFKQVGV